MEIETTLEEAIMNVMESGVEDLKLQDAALKASCIVDKST
jgi:hypothetical protein